MNSHRLEFGELSHLFDAGCFLKAKVESNVRLTWAGVEDNIHHSTVCKKKIFRNLIEYYSIYSYGKIKIVLEYRYASIS